MPTPTDATSPICPKRVRYIKLGHKGEWEPECLERGIVRLGFGTAKPARLDLCLQRRWGDLKHSFAAEGKDPGTTTNFTKQVRLFFEDDGTTMWLTFVGEHLCWGFLAPGAPAAHADGNGVWRTVAGGWRRTDATGEPLTKDRLAGSLIKLAAYRGTSCDVDVADYATRRINGQKSPEVEQAVAALAELKRAVLGMIRLLLPKDFEVLVELVFSTSGWRRQGVVGGTQKTLDLDLVLPSTGERAFVQVKSKTDSAELAGYVEDFEALRIFDRMFFAFHSGDAQTDDERVTVIGPDKLAEMTMEAGLANWLLRKVS